MSFTKLSLADKSLRPYQQESKNSIFAAWDKVHSVLFQMPTGTGKTRLFTSLINDINKHSVSTKTPVKILIIAHRTELIEQIHNSLGKYRVPHGLIIGASKREYHKPVQVASIQTFSNSNNLEAQAIRFDYIIIDEAHHAQAVSYRKLWALNPDARFLGVTATPWRMNNNGFGDLFEKLIESQPVKEFIKGNYLSGYKYISVRGDNPIRRQIAEIKDFDIEGDYKNDAITSILDQTKIRAELYKSYKEYADGKKGVIYAINREHAKHICDEYLAQGVNIASVDSTTAKSDRERIVSDFRSGKIQIIVNVDIFSEGFDCPDIDFVQLARPTRSLAKYLQQVGRALRISENKSEAIILDNVGMFYSFGLPDMNRDWQKYFIGVPKGSRGQKGVVYEHTNPKYISYKEGSERMVVIRDVEEEVLEKMRNRPLYWETDEGAMVLYKENSFYFKSPGKKYPDKAFDRFFNRLVNDKSHLVESLFAREKVGSRHLRIEKLRDSYTYILAIDRDDINYVLYRTKDKVSLIDETFTVLRIESEKVQFIELNYRNIEDYVSFRSWDSPINNIKDIWSLNPRPLIENIMLSAPKGSDLYSYVTEWEKKKRSVILKKKFSFEGKTYYWIVSGTIMYTFDEEFNFVGKGDYSESLLKNLERNISIVSLPMSNRYVITCNDNWGIYVSLVDKLTTARITIYKSDDTISMSFKKAFIVKEIDAQTCSVSYQTPYRQMLGTICIKDDNLFTFSEVREDDVIIDLTKMKKITND